MILSNSDDFGTRYSSLSYLHKLPVSRIKIDKSFVDSLPSSKEHIAIVEAIIALSRSFDLATTVESVETKEQAEFLKSLGCNEMQGYYYSKPLRYEMLERYLYEGN